MIFLFLVNKCWCKNVLFSILFWLKDALSADDEMFSESPAQTAKFLALEPQASLAQSVERRSHNPEVVSSILTGSTCYYFFFKIYFYFFSFGAEGLTRVSGKE